jgi:hypothetical protein
VLACDEGRTNEDIAAELMIHPVTVSMWRTRFAADRLDGLVDAPRPGVGRTIGGDTVEAVVVATWESAPADATHWSSRESAPSHKFCSGFRIESRSAQGHGNPSVARHVVPDGHRANHRGGLAECLRKQRVGELRLSKPGR